MDFLFGSPCDLSIRFADEESHPRVALLGIDEKRDMLPLFMGTDPVKGSVSIDIKGKPLAHLGIKIELIGQIELLYDRTNPHQFINQVCELEPAGELSANRTYEFEFNCDRKEHNKQYETFRGNNVNLRYFVRVQITRSFSSSNVTVYKDFAVQNISPAVEVNNTIKMEVGIEDCLHIEFEYNKTKYDLNGIVIGKIYFLLVRIKIKHMEIVIIKRESTGSGAESHSENDTIAKYEIMDGAPVRGESIPVRLFLAPYQLSPTMKNIHNLFSVKYMLNLVLVDEEDRRYFKQQEIILYRSQPSVSSGAAALATSS